MARPDHNLSPEVSDQVCATTCYMCACRCGINVHLKNGSIRYIEGNPNHPVNQGVLCAKGNAGIMHQYSPARLRKPLKRTGPRGSGQFEEISWDEALNLATEWLSEVRANDPRKLAFFTGRDQSQALTGFWASQFGTCNYAAHGGFCSVNMAAAGLYTIGGSFWEFGEPDWERSRLVMLFGVAEDHDSNPIKTGLAHVKKNGGKVISVNPVRTGYSAIADEWLPIRPGTDGMFIFALIHELLRSGNIDLDYLMKMTNAAWLVIDAPDDEAHGTFARNDKGEPLCFDLTKNAVRTSSDGDLKPALHGEFVLSDGRKVRPSFAMMAERYLDEAYSPAKAADITGISQTDIERIAKELVTAAFDNEIYIEQPWTDWRGNQHKGFKGRPVAMHAMRGISAHKNGFHTCRALHLLQILLGSIEVPGGFRIKAPFPKPCPPGPQPAGKKEQMGAGAPMTGPPLGFTRSPEDLIINDDGSPRRIDKAYSWEAPLSAHGMMHTVIANAYRGDPYKIDVLFMYMANMAWNSAMNTAGTVEMLEAVDPETGEYVIPKFIYSDAFASETVAYADLVLPDTTYLERYDCISLLDRPISSAEAVADSIRHPVLPVDRDVRPFQDVIIDLGVRLKLPAFCKEDGHARYPGGYKDYIVHHERKPGVGPLFGFRGEDGDKTGIGSPNPDQMDQYIANGGFFCHEFDLSKQFYKHINSDYLNEAKSLGLIDHAAPIFMQIYCEPLQKFKNAANGLGNIQPPDNLRKRIRDYCDPLPFWEDPAAGTETDKDDYPFYAITQRPMPMYHSWGSQNAWLRQLSDRNYLYMNDKTAKELGIGDNDWVLVKSSHGEIHAPVKTMHGVERQTVWTWNALGKRKGAWNLADGAGEFNKGFLLNHLIEDVAFHQQDGVWFANADPVTGQAAWYDLRVRIQKAEPPRAENISKKKAPSAKLPKPPKSLQYGAQVAQKEDI